MTGGGARAAYQVGFLRFLAAHHPDVALPILTGVSAGAINAAGLAHAGGPLAQRVEKLADAWLAVRVDRVFKVGTFGLLGRVLRVGGRLIGGGRRPASAPRSLVDTSPLRDFLLEQYGGEGGLHRGIQRNLDSGSLRSVAITGSSYATGRSVTWIQGTGVRTWNRAHRTARLTHLTADHVMASSALPLIFPAVQVNGRWYGDGGIRLTAPLSSAVHLGAQRVLAISTRYGRTLAEAEVPVHEGYPPPAQVAGTLLNAIFLDQLDADALRLDRINNLLEDSPHAKEAGLRPVRLLVLRPSQDLGKLANDYEADLPRAFRFLTRGLGTRETRSNDFLSMLMFQSDYVQTLIDLGQRDAEAHADRIAAFLAGQKVPSNVAL